VEAETIAGNSGELQFRMLCASRVSWCMAPVAWHFPYVVAEASPCRKFWLAQSGGQLGAPSNATIASRLNVRSGRLAIRICIAFGILIITLSRPPACVNLAVPLRTGKTMLHPP